MTVGVRGPGDGWTRGVEYWGGWSDVLDEGVGEAVGGLVDDDVSLPMTKRTHRRDGS